MSINLAVIYQTCGHGSGMGKKRNAINGAPDMSRAYLLNRKG